MSTYHVPKCGRHFVKFDDFTLYPVLVVARTGSCENYRGITLMSVPGKVFNRILLERMRDAVDFRFRDHQSGFRRDRSCTDQIATLRIIVEQSLEWDSSLYVNFVDFLKAFDSLHHDTL